MLTYFVIDRDRSDALIRPDTFDRRELRFDIRHVVRQGNPEGVLRSVLYNLPDHFLMPRAPFFSPAGRDTASGIVFVPTLNGNTHNLMGTREVVRHATGAEVTVYSGGTPRGRDRQQYVTEKRENAAAFKSNHVPVLVATKAFGMGIDKPNIRYTIHYGMPQSLEAFYQEAGRAGRDERPSLCTVVFSEHDPATTDWLLDPDLDMGTLRRRYDEVKNNKAAHDDVTQSLYFHLTAFSGIEPDLQDIDAVLIGLGELIRSYNAQVSFDLSGGKERTEKAVYRLLRLGVIADYTIEWTTKRFNVVVNPLDFDRCKEQLREYVAAAQPARARIVEQRLEAIPLGSPIDKVRALARILVEFTYDVIERSRRRMLQEAVLLARQAQSDSEIRRRLLDYLQEGFGAEALDALLQTTEIDLAAWLERAVAIQTPIDAGELRGLCIRALESYPDHPGLLLVRAVAEAMCSDHDPRVSAQGIASALQRAAVDYGIAASYITEIVGSLFDFAITRAPGLCLPLTYALLILCQAVPQMEFIRQIAKERVPKIAHAHVQAVMVAAKAEEVVEHIDGAVKFQVGRYSRR